MRNNPVFLELPDGSFKEYFFSGRVLVRTSVGDYFCWGHKVCPNGQYPVLFLDKDNLVREVRYISGIYNPLSSIFGGRTYIKNIVYGKQMESVTIGGRLFFRIGKEYWFSPRRTI